MLSLPVRYSQTMASSMAGSQIFRRSLFTSSRLYGTKVFLTPSIGGKTLLPIKFELYDEVVPKTTANFKALCTGEKGFGYKNSPMHRIIPNFMIQGGDFETGRGFGGKSIYGESFPDENFEKKHDKRGLLSMANRGPNTNGSQFFITSVPCPWLDGNHVVFGEVIDGFDSVEAIENQGSQSGSPKSRVIVEDAGEVR